MSAGKSVLVQGLQSELLFVRNTIVVYCNKDNLQDLQHSPDKFKLAVARHHETPEIVTNNQTVCMGKSFKKQFEGLAKIQGQNSEVGKDVVVCIDEG